LVAFRGSGVPVTENARTRPVAATRAADAVRSRLSRRQLGTGTVVPRARRRPRPSMRARRARDEPRSRSPALRCGRPVTRRFSWAGAIAFGGAIALVLGLLIDLD